MNTTLHTTRRDDRCLLTLVPPEGKPVTLDQAVIKNLSNTLDELERQPPAVVIVESGAPKYFCVGANLKALQQIDENTIGAWVEQGHDVLNRLEALPCPVIAKVTGYALGGGLELAMACDLIAASSTAKLGQPEAGLGFIPGWGGTFRLPERIGAARAKRLFMTGETLTAFRAEQLGLVDFFHETEGFEDAFEAFIDRITANNAHALSAFKKILHADRASQLAANMRAEVAHSLHCVHDADTRERLRNFFKGR